MNIEKAIYSFAVPFIRVNSFLLFILFCVSFTISTVSGNHGLSYLFYLFSNTGWVFFLLWIYAIGYKSNEKIKANGFALKNYRYFLLAFPIIIIYGLIKPFVTTEVSHNAN